MAKDRDVKFMIKRVNDTMSRLEKFLDNVKINAEDGIEVEKDRVSYKEGLVDGICMYSWQKGEDSDDDADYVGSPTADMKLSDVLDEIGSVYGFDGKAELERVKMVEEIDKANVEVLDNKPLKDEIDPDAEETKVTDIKGKEVEIRHPYTDGLIDDDTDDNR